VSWDDATGFGTVSSKSKLTPGGVPVGLLEDRAHKGGDHGPVAFGAARRQVGHEMGVGRHLHNTHKMANVMNAPPKSAQPAARTTLAEVRDAEDKEHAIKALALFKKDYEAKWPKAVDKDTKDTDGLLAFFDFPAEDWVHLKTTNPIESTFATVRRAHQVLTISQLRSTRSRTRHSHSPRQRKTGESHIVVRSRHSEAGRWIRV